jgi:hypothetical protein
VEAATRRPLQNTKTPCVIVRVAIRVLIIIFPERQFSHEHTRETETRPASGQAYGIFFKLLETV